MTAIASLDALINNLTGGGAVAPDHRWFYVDARIQAAAATAPVAGRFLSLWQNNKTNGANGGVPPAASAAVAPTRSTIGALPFTDATGGRQKWLLGVENGMAVIGTLIVYDRLVHCAGIALNALATTTITGGAVTRYTGAESDGNQIWLEFAGANQVLSTTQVTVSYTNQAGTAGRTTKAILPVGNINAMMQCPLADGDTGVQSVQSLTVSTLAGTASSTCGVVIVRPLAIAMSSGVGGGSVRDLVAGLPSMPEIKTDACIAFAFYANTTTAVTGFVGLHLAEN